MAKILAYSMEKILAAREALRNLPAKEKEKSRGEVVEFLKMDLRKAVKQGHSLKEIQAILAEQGIAVSLSSMEAVLGQSGKDSARKKVDSGLPSPKVTEAQPAADVPKTNMPKSDVQKADVPKNETVKPETLATIPPRKPEPEPLPSYYTPDLPDDQL